VIEPDNHIPGKKNSEEFDIGQQTVSDIKKTKRSSEDICFNIRCEE
jgi:hypothetical protein